jgi:hypothetical protein
MDWKMKLMDELVSRTVIMAVVFAVPLFFVQLGGNEKAYIVLASMAVGGGYVKSIQNTFKSVAKEKANGKN